MVGMIVHIPLSLVLGKFIGAYGVVVSMTLITISYCIFFTLQLRRILQNEACGIWNA